jgi:hypothetical protein
VAWEPQGEWWWERSPGVDPVLWLPAWQKGTYLPQTYIIQEEMVLTEHVSDKEALGSFIYHLCNGKDTYRLRRRATRRREWPTLAPAPNPGQPLAVPGPAGLVFQWPQRR